MFSFPKKRKGYSKKKKKNTKISQPGTEGIDVKHLLQWILNWIKTINKTFIQKLYLYYIQAASKTTVTNHNINSPWGGNLRQLHTIDFYTN